jgi:hypothetical protein
MSSVRPSNLEQNVESGGRWLCHREAADRRAPTGLSVTPWVSGALPSGRVRTAFVPRREATSRLRRRKPRVCRASGGGPNWVLIKPSAASARTAHRLPLSPLQILMPVITSNRVRAASPRQGAQPIASRDARSVGFLSRLPRSGNVQLARRPRHGPEPLYGEARRNPADLARAAN